MAQPVDIGYGCDSLWFSCAYFIKILEHNEELILAIRQNVDIAQCVFELATPRVGSTTVQIYAGKKFLVKTFGPDVNLGNVTPDVIIETETTRLGLGSAGPLDFLEKNSI